MLVGALLLFFGSCFAFPDPADQAAFSSFSDMPARREISARRDMERWPIPAFLGYFEKLRYKIPTLKRDFVWRPSAGT